MRTAIAIVSILSLFSAQAFAAKPASKPGSKPKPDAHGKPHMPAGATDPVPFPRLTDIPTGYGSCPATFPTNSVQGERIRVLDH